MLDALRQGARGWTAKILMGLLVLSFAIWGISGDIMGYGAGTVARVGDQEITVNEFAQTQDRLQQIAAGQGRQVSPEQVLDQLLLDAALADQARDQNLGISDDRLAREIAENEEFHRAGSFDRELFQLLLANARIDQDDYIRDVRQELVRGQIASSIAAGIDVPQPMVEALYRFQNEDRAISFVEIGETAIEPVGTPEPAVLQAYFEENKAAFRAPEYRRLGMIVIDPAEMADPAAITEEQIATEYAQRQAGFTRPERRRIEQLTFDTREAAEAALQELQAGTDVAAVAEQNGINPATTDQGLKTRAEVLDQALAEAAFAAEPNVIVPVLDGALAPTIIRVTEIEPGSVTPLEEVSDRLRQELATRGARERIQTLYDGIEDERAAGATLEEVSQTLSVPYQVVEAVAADGTAPDGSPVDLPGGAQLLSDAFESDVGVENSPVRAGNDTYVFYEVLEIIPARDRTLDEVRDQVVAAWQAEQTEARITERAEALLERARQGESLAAIAAELGAEVRTVEGLRRGATQGLSQNAAAQAFAGPENYVAVAEADSPPNRILLKVDRVTAPAFFPEAADAQAISQQLSQALQNDLLQSYNRQVLQSRETRINNATYSQLTGSNLAQ